VDVLHLVLIRQKLVQVTDMFSELLAEQGLVLPALPLLDEVDDDQGAPVLLQQEVEVLTRSQRVRVLDEQQKTRRNLSDQNVYPEM